MKKIFISFSGGKTSAYMTQRIVKEYGDSHDIKILFANTGQEHEKTLEFIHKFEKYYNLDIHWIESVVMHGERKSSRGKRVCFDTACRDHRLFEQMIIKYGIPNFSFPHCTRELKTNPMHNYIKEVIGWKHGKYQTAIGIRADEIDRINDNYKKLGYWYPLAFDWSITKKDINDFWNKMPFNLDIPEHLGNCIWCWKKSLKKQMAIIRDMPCAHDVPEYLEGKYPTTIKNGKVFSNQVFFRKNKSSKDLRDIYISGDIEAFVDDQFNDCKESCEPF